MEQVKWCMRQKRGIEIVKPNRNLRNAYTRKAEDALDTFNTSKSRDWQLTAAYYCIYQSIYSLLMELGVKCEIHSCTIEFTKSFLDKYFTNEDYELVDKAFSARIDSQYYVDRVVPDKNYELIKEKTSGFLVKCKNIVLTEKEINEIRDRLRSLE